MSREKGIPSSKANMNQMRAIQKMNEDELAHGIAGTSASWHSQYQGNAWIYAGGLSDRLSEGDVLAVFSQYGEIEDLHLVRDSETGKSKGFAFLKYEDERSTILSVDNLNGAQLLGRALRVDHTDYRPPKKKKAEEQADEANGAEYQIQTSGHAYVGQDLASGHSLDNGVNVFYPDSSAAIASRESTDDRKRKLDAHEEIGALQIPAKRLRREEEKKMKGKKDKKDKKDKKSKKGKKGKKHKKDKKKKNKKKKKKDKKKQEKEGSKSSRRRIDTSDSDSSGGDSSDGDREMLAAAQAFLKSSK